MLNIWMLNISFKHFYVKRQFYALGRFFSRDSHLLTHDRHHLNIRLHLFLWFQDPVSVPESICIVGDTRTNTSQSCNNDNYDSNKSEKSSLRCNCCIACLAAIELTVVVIIPSVLKMYPSPLCWPHHQSHQLIDHPSFIFKIWWSISDRQYVSRYKLSFRNQGFIQTFFLTLSIKISGWRWRLIQMPSDLFAVDKNWMRKSNIISRSRTHHWTLHSLWPTSPRPARGHGVWDQVLVSHGGWSPGQRWIIFWCWKYLL